MSGPPNAVDLARPETATITPTVSFGASVSPFLAASAVAVLGAVLGSVISVILGLLAMAALAPVAVGLSRRALVAFLWWAGIAGAASLIPGYSFSALGLVVVVIMTVAVVLPSAMRASRPKGAPTLRREEWLVLLGGAGLLGMLVLPIWGRGPELVLLDSAANYDNLHHYIKIAGLVDGSERIPLYPYGYHAAQALMLGIASDGVLGSAAVSVSDYAKLGMVLATACALVLGFLALEAARTWGPIAKGPSRWVSVGTGVAFAVSAPLAGLFVSFLNWGHMAFLWAVCAVSVASWLALDRALPPRRSAWFLGLGIISAFTVYRSTQVGLAPAAFLVVMWWVGSSSWLRSVLRWPAALGASAAVFAGWVPFHYYSVPKAPLPGLAEGESDSMLAFSGGLAAPAGTTLVSVQVLALLGLVVLLRFRMHEGFLRLVPAGLGFAAFACVFGLAIVRSGNAISESYYLWKSASAVWIAGFPALLLVAVAAFAPRGRGLAARALGVVGTALVVALIVVLPHGDRAMRSVPSGLVMAERRMDYLDVPPGGAGVLAAAGSVGTASEAAVLLPNDSWSSLDEYASGWMNAVRGSAGPGNTTLPPEQCVAEESWVLTEKCYQDWLRDNPGERLLIVDTKSVVPRDSDLLKSENVEVLMLDVR